MIIGIEKVKEILRVNNDLEFIGANFKDSINIKVYSEHGELVIKAIGYNNEISLDKMNPSNLNNSEFYPVSINGGFMELSDALLFVRHGCRIAREEWDMLHSDKMYIYMQSGAMITKDMARNNHMFPGNSPQLLFNLI